MQVAATALTAREAMPIVRRLMRPQTDPDPDAPQADTAHLSVVRFYLCANRACEHAERADRAA